MKKWIFISSLLTLLSCDDGDLQIETLDFDSITQVQNCGTVSATDINVLFKINADEALILTLPAELIKNEITTEDKESAIPSNSKLSYRVFSENVTASYFCDSPPPLTPTVSEEIEAAAGLVIVTTTTEDNITFTHTIKLSGITLLNTNGSRITDQQINEFGTITTTAP